MLLLLIFQMALVISMTIPTLSISSFCDSIQIVEHNFTCSCIVSSTRHELDCGFFKYTLARNERLGELKCSDSFSTNDFTKLPQKYYLNDKIPFRFIFKNCPFPNSSLSEVIKKFKELSSVKVIKFDAGQRILKNITKEHFSSLDNVSILLLQGESLTNINTDPFVYMKNLTTLKFDFPQIDLHSEIFKSTSINSLIITNAEQLTFPEKFFANLGSLKNLTLIKIEKLNFTPNIFEGLYELRELTLTDNDIQNIDKNVFGNLLRLKKIVMDHNILHISSDTNEIFYNNTELEVFHLLENRNTIQLPQRLFNNLKKLSEIKIENSNIEQLPEEIFYGSNQIKNLSLAGNKISKINTNNTFKDQYNIEELYLSNNNLQYIADGTFQSLRNLKILNLNNNYMPKIQRELLTGLVSLKKLMVNNNNLQEIEENSFLSNGEIELLDMSWNQLSFPNSNSPFKTLEKLNNLNLSHNNLTKICNDWKILCLNLKILDVSYNNINEIKFGNAMNKLKELYINKNNISHLSPKDIPVEIETLSLESNNLQQIGQKIIEQIDSNKLKNVHLLDNPFICNCENKFLFLFLQNKHLYVKGYNKLTCWNKNNSIFIDKLHPNDLCLTHSPISHYIYFIIIMIAVISFTMCLLIIVYYKYNETIKIWLFSKGWYFPKQEFNDNNDKDKIYDAFISFSHEDENFVINEIVETLENNRNKYKLCVHFRDWIPGEYIPTQIARSIKNSRRTLIILSPSFLKSVWGRMEFQAAHKTALKDGKIRLIMILYGDIKQTDQLDPELQAYLNMNTYVKWGDPWFWNKLLYSLPHHNNINNNNLPVQSVLKKNEFNDRIESNNYKNNVVVEDKFYT